MTTMTKTPRPFAAIDTWVFDLDNTLYPHHVNLWQQVDARIGEFIAAWLKTTPEQARVIQKDYYRRYGTSMRGMMTEHGVRADDYLAYVHKIDHSPLEPNPAMGAAIARLPGHWSSGLLPLNVTAQTVPSLATSAAHSSPSRSA